MPSTNPQARKAIESMCRGLGVPLSTVVGRGEPREALTLDELDVWWHGVDNGIKHGEAHFFHPFRFRRYWWARIRPHFVKFFNTPHPHHSVDA